MNTMTSTIVLSADEVLSRRHLPSMLALAMAAGAVNAAAFLICQRFVTHATGTVTQIGLDVGRWMLFLDYVLILVSFIVGAMLSALWMQRRASQGLRPRPAVPLFAASLVLIGTAIAGAMGLFGDVGGAIEETGDFAFLTVLALSMGLMNATVASATAVAVRTTHMTGPASDFGVTFVSAWFHDGEARRMALRLAGLRGGKIVFFAIGAASMLPLERSVGFTALTVPALIIALATLRSFVWVQADARATASRPVVAPAS
jgi:uncharacterized membrane protein YoaK (UPF0700 family)